MTMMRLMGWVLAFSAAQIMTGCDPDGVQVPANKLEVVIEKGAAPTVRFAAAEMTNILERMSRVAVPVVNAPSEGRYPIFLGTNAWSHAAGLRPEKLKRDSYCVSIDEKRTIICGCDDPKRDPARGFDASGYERATLFGVYGFLDRHAGVRFYFPGELGTVVPAASGLKLSAGSYTVTPRFSHRDCYINGAGPYPGIPVDNRRAQDRAKSYYKLMLRESTEKISCCHGQNNFRIAERFSESHPEYFQLRKNGTRCTGTKFEHNWMGRQLCHTSPVWDIFRKETLERIRKGAKYVDVMPQDGMSPCWCETCQKTFNTTNFTLSSGYATELIWGNTVKIANAITAAGLTGGVSQMAYGTYRNIPSVDIPSNVAVVLAVGGPWSESHPDIRDQQIDFVRIWAEKLKRPVAWIWTYPMKNYGRLQAPDVPQIAPRAYAKFYTLAEPYIDGSFVESNVGETLVQNYLNFYVFTRLAWDGKVDVESLLAEHHCLMFGKGAAAMTKFFDALEKKWIGEMALPSLIGETEIGPMLYGPTDSDIWKKIYPPAFVAELGALLADATAAVLPGSLEARRIAWIKEELFDRLARHSKAFMDETSVEVERARRAACKDATALVDTDRDGWKGWTLPSGAKTEGTSVSLQPTGKNLYVGFNLREKSALKPNTKYRLSYFVRTDKLVSPEKRRSGYGACMEVEQYGDSSVGGKYTADRTPKANFIAGDQEWIHQKMEFATGDKVGKGKYKAMLWLRLFACKGTACFDGVRLEEVKD